MHHNAINSENFWKNSCFSKDAFYMVTSENWESKIVWNEHPPDPSTLEPPKLVPLLKNTSLIDNNWEENIIFDAQNFEKPLIIDVESSKEPSVADPATLKYINGEQTCVGQLSIKADRPKCLFDVSNDSCYVTRIPFQKAWKSHGLHHTKIARELSIQLLTVPMDKNSLENFYHPKLRPLPTRSDPYEANFQAINLLGPDRIQETTFKCVSRNQKQDPFSALSGKLILMEFFEEHPPLINQIGMRARIKQYFKDKALFKKNSTPCKYGEKAVAPNNLFLGSLRSEQCLLVLENALYRSIIFMHQTNPQDFLLIRSGSQYYIRKFDSLFLAGQQYPLQIVPEPNSKKFVAMQRDLVQASVYRVFRESTNKSKSLDFSAIKAELPNFPEKVITKRLRECADFKASEQHPDGVWVLKQDFRLPSEEEIQETVKTEDYCAYLSMLMAVQRLRNLGYGERFLIRRQEEDDDDFLERHIEDELLAAPWHTTRAFVEAMEKKCLLAIEGPADPTGCGLGFSYGRVPKKRTLQSKKRKVNFDAANPELKRLTKARAMEMLRDFKVPDEYIIRLKRSEMILTLHKLKSGKVEVNDETLQPNSNREIPGKPVSRVPSAIERQRLFELQNNALSNPIEPLTDNDDDDDGSTEEDHELEYWGRELETLLECTAPTTRMLVIKRSHIDGTGRKYVHTHIYTKDSIVAAYEKIRTTKDEHFIKQFVALSKKKATAPIRKQALQKKNQRMMKINTVRPGLACLKKYERQKMTKKQQMPKANFNEAETSQEAMVAVDILDGGVDVKAANASTSFPKKKIGVARKAALKSKLNSNPSLKMSNEPFEVLCKILSETLAELALIPEFKKYLFDNDLKSQPKFRQDVSSPMDLQAIQTNLKALAYRNCKDFLNDLKLFYETVVQLYGLRALHALTASDMVDKCLTLLSKRKDELLCVEKALRSIQEDPNQMALTHQLQLLMSSLKANEQYGAKSNLMTLEIISKKIDSHFYYSTELFLNNLQSIVSGGDGSSGDSQPADLRKSLESLMDYALEEFAQRHDFYKSIEGPLKKSQKKICGELSKSLAVTAKQKGKANDKIFSSDDSEEEQQPTTSARALSHKPKSRGGVRQKNSMFEVFGF